jgi:NADH:ubiquinone oxidoreductase subunit 2 (subunit N)
MLWCSFIELDALLSLILIIVYGLFCLRAKQLQLPDVYLFSRLFPVLFVLSSSLYVMDVSSSALSIGIPSGWGWGWGQVWSFDLLLALLLCFIMYSLRSFESVLLLLFAFIGQYYMLHSVDLLGFYIALEAQNFSFLVLCGLQTSKQNHSFSVQAALRYLLLSAFSSGVILFWFSALYLQSGLSVLMFKAVDLNSELTLMPYGATFQVLCAMMFKLGAAPLHLWVAQIYNGVTRNLLMYISTAPKLSLFGFWTSSFQAIWTDYSVLLFSVFSVILGSFGAYNQPGLRSLFAYSTVNEIGLLLAALETAGFHSLYQHLGIYIISQLLLWNIQDKRLFTFVAVSLAGLPPLAGFFGKAFVFWHVSNTGLFSLLLVALLCTAISLVYYLRVIRLFWNSQNRSLLSSGQHPVHTSVVSEGALSGSRVMLTSTCALLLTVIPLFVMKPYFVL